jgi:hypothetical protein
VEYMASFRFGPVAECFRAVRIVAALQSPPNDPPSRRIPPPRRTAARTSCALPHASP